MISFNFEKKIDNLIAERPQEVIAQVKANIPSAFQFDILKRQYIEKLWETKGISDDIYAISICEKELNEIDFSKTLSAKEFIDKVLVLLNNGQVIEINKNLEVINTQQITNATVNMCCNISKEKKCIYLLSRNGIKIIVGGEIVSENYLFIDEQDSIEYSKKMDISQIKEAFKIYQQLLDEEDLNVFFESDKALELVTDKKNQNNILKYRPEKYIKEHLRAFLNKNIRRTFNMNYLLSYSGREIDIYTEDKDFYFFTIKWLGVSVNDTGVKLIPPNTELDAKRGVAQTLEYVRELREYEEYPEKKFKKGYLIIIDARDIKTPIVFDLENIDADLKKYSSYFDVIDNIKIDKRVAV